MPDGGNLADQLVDQRIDPHRIAQDMEQVGMRWADSQNAANLLDKTWESVKAELILNMRDSVEPGEKKLPWNEAELRAKASEEWANHTYAMVEARHKANQDRVRYDALKAKFEALRTAEASRRAELQNLGRL
jgi:hypothetical protein